MIDDHTFERRLDEAIQDAEVCACGDLVLEWVAPRLRRALLAAAAAGARAARSGADDSPVHDASGHETPGRDALDPETAECALDAGLTAFALD